MTREKFLTQRLAERSAELSRLRGGIQDYLDGDWGRNIPRKVDTCEHGKFGWEACDNCIDAYFTKILNGK